MKWEMDVEADTPEEAARVARDYQLDPEAIVGVFDVYKRDGHGGNEHPPVRVDLDALEGRYDDDAEECLVSTRRDQEERAKERER